ncbi:hypothetical protein COP2_023227 [Malus domestica]
MACSATSRALPGCVATSFRLRVNSTMKSASAWVLLSCGVGMLSRIDQVPMPTSLLAEKCPDYAKLITVGIGS